MALILCNLIVDGLILWWMRWWWEDGVVVVSVESYLSSFSLFLTVSYLGLWCFLCYLISISYLGFWYFWCYLISLVLDLWLWAVFFGFGFDFFYVLQTRNHLTPPTCLTDDLSYLVRPEYSIGCMSIFWTPDSIGLVAGQPQTWFDPTHGRP